MIRAIRLRTRARATCALSPFSLVAPRREVIFEVLLQKSDHVERFVDYARNPRAISRFHERMSEYKQFWGRVHQLCARYLASVPLHHAAYGFLSSMGPGDEPRREASAG